MTCIKTGADVFLREYGNKVVHGDLFEVGNTYILKCNGTVEQCSYYLEEGETHKVHIVVGGFEECGQGVIAFTKLWASDFEYNGLTVTGR